MSTRLPVRAFAISACAVLWLTLTGIQPMAAQEAPAPAREEATVHSKTLIDLYQEGGWVMHMIALTSIATLAVLSFCLVSLNKGRLMPGRVVTALNDALRAQDAAKAIAICNTTPSVLSTVIREALEKAGTGVTEYTKADLEAAAGESIFHEETRLMLWVNMLNAFAAVAPMIGLLGTVSGMIQSFEKLSAGAAKPSDFAGGIGEAMVGTAGGLLVAIPAMFAYFYFKNSLQSLMSEVARSASNLIGRFVTGAPQPAA
ncbi:MAG: MotA/TolQ/ExbB proton channel family protein [Verrucomicrobia bacterium]|nr:MotA/TolQ/ExbB proton channel family protein [Verrucomicrobiota bacterium]